MIKSTNLVPIYEIDGSAAAPVHGPALVVESHWNMMDRVVLVVEGKKFTVIKADIIAAIDNATNTARF